MRGETRSPIEKSEQNPTSLRLAINAKCYDCQGQDADPGWRQRIADCYLEEGLRFDKDNHWDPLVRNYAAEKYYELGK